MKNTFTVAEITVGNEFKNEQEFAVQNVVFTTVEKLKQFEKVDGVKNLVERAIFKLKKSEFTRLLALDAELVLLPKGKTQAGTSAKEALEIAYEDHIQLLHGAQITIEREERTETVLSDEPELDKNGNPVLDANEDVVYKLLLDEEGKPVTRLVGFGETKLLKLELSAPAKKLLEKKLGF